MGNKATKSAEPTPEKEPESSPKPPVSDNSEIEPPTKPELPPLPLANIQEPPKTTPPEPEEDLEDDPDLMKPPPLLLDSTDSVDEKMEGATSIRDPSDEDGTLMLSQPVTHHQVLFEDPTPYTEPEKFKDLDAISIEDEISALEETESKLNLGSKTSSMQLEDAVSVTSSAVKADEEYMKGIMGVSLNAPDATSNESIHGSMAISEQTIDEALWSETHATSSKLKKLDVTLEFVSVELREENDQVKVGLNCVPTDPGMLTMNSIASDKQMSIELKTPFVSVSSSNNEPKAETKGQD